MKYYPYLSFNMAASRSCIFFRQMRQLTWKRNLDNVLKPHALCFSTDKEDITPNLFDDKYAKYADKIKLAQQSYLRTNHRGEQPLSNFFDNALKKEVDEFKEKMKRASNLKKKNTIGSNSSSGCQSLYGEKGLDAIMHLKNVEKVSAESIEKLWREYHRNKESVSAVIPGSMYDVIQERAQKYPVFVYPVPQSEGYELMVGEFSNHQCYVTSVLNYQTLGENAPWLVAFTHFTELKESKGIVLMVGEVDTKCFTTHEAMLVANLIQLYYGTDDDAKLSLLKTFNTDPDKFDHMSVVKEMQSSTVQADGTSQFQ